MLEEMQAYGMVLKTMVYGTPKLNMTRTRGSSVRVVQSVGDAFKKSGTVYEDEIVLTEETGSEYSYTEVESRRIVRRLDRWILPILCISFGLQ